MKPIYKSIPRGGALATTALAVLLSLPIGSAQAAIQGITGVTAFHITAGPGEVSIADGGTGYFWGYQDLDNHESVGVPQYPGPTMIVNQGEAISITFTSSLPNGECSSIMFPGQKVAASGGSAGVLTNESCGATDPVTYTFTADQPGTYMYYSGTHMDLQIEMGLVGALIVRPSGYSDTARKAYGPSDTAFTYEYLFLLTSMDPLIHAKVEQNALAGLPSANGIDMSVRWPVYWFINGRAGPDDLAAPYVSWLPHQPYNCAPRMTPGDRMLVRIIGADKDQHPLHLHGNTYEEIARDGRLLSTNGSSADLRQYHYTTDSVPGQTVDAIFEWTGAELGWDVYGHAPGDPMAPNEYAPDHGKPFPVTLPENQNLAFGGWWSGSPFLGQSGQLPPGEGGLNPYSGLFFMWHSHAEKELTNYDIFPGGMMTMMVVEPPGTPIE